MCSSSELIKIMSALASQINSQTLATLIGIFIFSVLSSAHCVVTCGIVGRIATYHLALTKRSFGFTIFNLGRILAYIILGSLCGYLGEVIAKLLGSFSNTGLTVLTYVLIFTFLGRFLLAKEITKKNIYHFTSEDCCTPKRTKHSYFRPAILGFLTPFFPCIALASILLFASTSGNALNGALYLLVFGIGTLPAVILAFMTENKLFVRFSSKTKTTLNSVMCIAAFILITYKISF